MDNFREIDISRRSKLRKGAGWLMTSMGGFNLLVSIILIGILSIILYFAINELSDTNARTEPVWAVGLSWIIMFDIIGLIVFFIGTILSSFLIFAGLNMRQGRRRAFVAVVTIIWAVIVSLSFFHSIIDMVFYLSIFTFIKFLFLFVVITLWGFLIYSLVKTWDTFTKKVYPA